MFGRALPRATYVGHTHSMATGVRPWLSPVSIFASRIETQILQASTNLTQPRSATNRKQLIAQQLLGKLEISKLVV